ncbi:hypothetical protein BZA77DRAFT_137620 [Pyronema omphalodes]|nr:hypothetical protein BZA77DRAFT_137620 [Pyronema omphalodes]
MTRLTLSTLPPELLLEVIRHVSPQDLFSLLLTSRLFNSLFKLHHAHILPCLLPAYPEALLLVQAQGSRDIPQTLLTNAAAVSGACDLFHAETSTRFHRNTPLLPCERARFYRAFYRLWTAVTIHIPSKSNASILSCPSDRFAQTSLAHLTMEELLPMSTTIEDRELQCMLELAVWMLLDSSLMFKREYLPGYAKNWAAVLGRAWRLGFTPGEGRVGSRHGEHPVGFVKEGGERGGFFDETGGFREVWDSLYGMAGAVLAFWPGEVVPVMA